MDENSFFDILFLPRQQLLYFVGIITSETTSDDFTSTTRLNNNVGKENMLINLDAGDGTKPYLGFLTTNLPAKYYFLEVSAYMLLCPKRLVLFV